MQIKNRDCVAISCYHPNFRLKWHSQAVPDTLNLLVHLLRQTEVAMAASNTASILHIRRGHSSLRAMAACRVLDSLGVSKNPFHCNKTQEICAKEDSFWSLVASKQVVNCSACLSDELHRLGCLGSLRDRSCHIRRSFFSSGRLPSCGTGASNVFRLEPVSALRSGPDYAEEKRTTIDTGDMHALEGAKWREHLINNSPAESDYLSDPSNLAFRVLYALGLYGGLAIAGNAMCTFTGVDCWGGFQLCTDAVMIGLGYAVPPMMLLLFILDDEVVKNWPPARALRDVEDEELMDFFYGMGPWQFFLVVIAGALAEELFFRVAIQGGLAHGIQMSGTGLEETKQGLSSLTSMLPLFLPFAQTFAAILSAALTGSMYYMLSSPRDPTYVIAPTACTPKAFRDIKKCFEAWHERRQLRKIYSPLMESLLALYLGFEWVQSGNILSPMITHTLYSIVVVGNGLLRIHFHRQKLRQRVAKIVGKQQKGILSS